MKLDANENPYGPPPGELLHVFFAHFPYSTNVEVRVALSQVEYPHIYPDPESRQLRAALVGVSVLQGYNRDLTKLW